MKSFDVSERQEPVVSALLHLLDEAKAAAAAISDNAYEDGHPIPRDLLISIASDLYKIKWFVEAAQDCYGVTRNQAKTLRTGDERNKPDS